MLTTWRCSCQALLTTLVQQKSFRIKERTLQEMYHLWAAKRKSFLDQDKLETLEEEHENKFQLRACDTEEK